MQVRKSGSQRNVYTLEDEMLVHGRDSKKVMLVVVAVSWEKETAIS